MNRLRELRHEAGLSAEALARKARVSLNTIWRAEARKPEAETCKRLARALGCSIEDIWSSEAEKALPPEAAS